MILTVEQKDVVRNIVKEIKINNSQIITFSGAAGTGKSTVLKVLMDILEKKGYSFCASAYTGKAANVLRKKGMNAQTIHSLIYRRFQNVETGETNWLLISKEDLAQTGIDGFCIDEASMVSQDIHDDLVSFGLPIIYIGDHNQLEPIGKSFNLMKNPMYKLETVHRNAGEIAHFAAHLRKGLPPRAFSATKQVQIVQESAIEDRHLASVDQVICAFNKTRVQLNNRVRKQKDIDLTFIAKNEKIICLRNNKKLGLFNGMQGIVQKIHKKERFDFLSDNSYFANIHYDPDQFGKEYNDFNFSQEANPFDYAYAITAFKSQGDEFGSVIAYEQKCEKWDHFRWCYTVATRAKNSLIWIACETYKPRYLI